MTQTTQEKNDVWEFLKELSTKRGITEVAINGEEKVFVERDGLFIQLNTKLRKEHVMNFIRDVAVYNKKECNIHSPIMDGTLPDGCRINIVVEPYAVGFPSISIRKYLKQIRQFDTHAELFCLTPDWVKVLKALVLARKNIIISGGTSAGKSTFLNLMLAEVEQIERLVVIEDTVELDIQKPNVVRLEACTAGVDRAPVSIRDLVKNSLRMRPDRIVVGEVRGPEVFDLLQAMNTGHNGSMGTIHSNSPVDCLKRLETLYMMSGYNIPVVAVRKQICDAVDFIIQLERDRYGKRHVSQITEISMMEGEVITWHDVAQFNDGKLRSCGMAPLCLHDLLEYGIERSFFSKIEK